MESKMRKTEFLTLVLGFMVAFGSMGVQSFAQGQSAPDRAEVQKRVRKELVTLPWYGVFDNLAYKVEGGTVTLYGQVVRPSTRSDAENRVERIPGVTRVVNNIRVLPLSSFDDSIRRRTYNEIRRKAGLYRYLMGANPSIHIIVDRGHVTLEGVVSTRGDANLAYIAARGVPGTFSVTNNLRVDSGRAY
jgi:hyperosmotically inducible protein